MCGGTWPPTKRRTRTRTSGQFSLDRADDLIDAISVFVVGWLVFYAYCLQKIGQRAGTPGTWWAWVPILNVLLMLRIAKKPLWWVVLFAVPFVQIYVLIKILADMCRAVGKSPWLAVPLLIPGVNLLVFAVLTGFTQKRFLYLLGALILLVLVLPSLPIATWFIVKNSLSIQMRALKHHDFWVRERAASNLGGLCPKTEVCVPALIEALHDPEILVRREAARALGEIGTEAKAAVPALIEVVEKDTCFASSDVVQALGNIGSPAKDAVPALMELRACNDENLSGLAATTIKRIGVGAPEPRTP